MAKAETHLCSKEAEITSIQTTLDLLVPNLEKIINANMSTVRAMMEANHDIQMLEFKGVKERQDRTNGRVVELEKTQRNFDKLVGEVIYDIAPIRWAKKHPIKAMGVSVFLIFVLIYVADTLSVETIISWIK